MTTNEKAAEICGFSTRPEGVEIILIDNITGRERVMTPADGNLWATVHQRLKDAECDMQSR